MSDEIIDVNAEEVTEEEKYMLLMKKDLPNEKLAPSGENIPDPDFVEVGKDNMEIDARRQEISQTIPSYPTEWQTGYKEDTKGFDDSADPLKINASFKEQEMRKIIKKYKRYLKSNITEVKRLES